MNTDGFPKKGKDFSKRRSIDYECQEIDIKFQRNNCMHNAIYRLGLLIHDQFLDL